MLTHAIPAAAAAAAVAEAPGFSCNETFAALYLPSGLTASETRHDLVDSQDSPAGPCVYVYNIYIKDVFMYA